MSMERFTAKLAWITAIVAVFFVFQAQADTLKCVVQHTIKTNPDVLTAAKIKHATNQEVHKARAGYFPTLDLHAGLGRERVKNSNTIAETGDYLDLWRHAIGLTLRQNVFHGWRDYYEVKRTKAKTDADAWAVCGTAQDITMETSEVYFNVLRERRKVSVAQNNLEEHQQIYHMIQERGKSGVGREADIAQATGRLALAKSNLYAIQNDHANTKVDYYKVTGLHPHGLVMPPDPSDRLLPRSKSEAIYDALRFHPKMRLAVVDVEERRAQHSVSHYTAFPRLDIVVEGEEGRNFNGSKAPADHYFAGLELNYNLFNGGYDVARQRETAYMTQEAAEIRNRTCREVTEKVSLAWNNLQTARIRLEQLRIHKEAAAKTKVAYDEQFKLGKRTLFDLLDAQNEQFTSSLAYVDGVFEVYILKYRLLHAMGKLVQFLNIATPFASHPEYHVYDHQANPVYVGRHWDARIWEKDRPSKWFNKEKIECEDFSHCIECSRPTEKRWAATCKDYKCMPASKTCHRKDKSCATGCATCPQAAQPQPKQKEGVSFSQDTPTPCLSRQSQHHASPNGNNFVMRGDKYAKRHHAWKWKPKTWARKATKPEVSKPQVSKKLEVSNKVTPEKTATTTTAQVDTIETTNAKNTSNTTTANKPHKVTVKTFKSAVSGYAVDVGQFHDQDEINEVVATLKNSGFNGFVKEIRTPTSLKYNLFIGPAKSRKQAVKLMTKLKDLNIHGKIVGIDQTA